MCSLPSEYCEFTPTIVKCKEWLQQHHDDLFQKLFAGVELTEKQQKTTEKHEAKQKRAEEKKMQSKVLIKRIERGKRKYVTGVFGLEIFGIEYVSLAILLTQTQTSGKEVRQQVRDWSQCLKE